MGIWWPAHDGFDSPAIHASLSTRFLMSIYQTTRLPNGVTVASATLPHMTSVSLGLWVGVGGRHEPAELSGISHFIEHMLFKGTARRSAEQISQSIEGIGGTLNAFTGEDHTCFYARVTHDRWKAVADVLADMFLHSRFDPADIAKERNVIKEELASYYDQPQQYVHELLNELQWPDQPLGRSLTGSLKTLNAMRRAHFVDYMAKHYVSGTTLICAAGRIEHAELVEVATKLTRRCPPGPKPAFAPANHPQTKPSIRLDTRKTEQTQLALGLHTASRHDPRRFALRLLNTIVGETMSSRLFVELRENRGLAYDIQSSASAFEDTGDFVVSAGLDADNLERSLKLILRELRRLTEEPVPAGELKRAKDYVIGQMELSLESTEHYMMTLGEQLLGFGRVIPQEDVVKRLRAVRASDLRRTMSDFLRPERMSLALVSPLKDGRGMEKILARASA
jgi:predicted Zn-dependent peptidase